VADTETDEEPDLLALALVRANRQNIALLREVQRLRLENHELAETVEILKDYVRYDFADENNV